MITSQPSEPGYLPILRMQRSAAVHQTGKFCPPMGSIAKGDIIYFYNRKEVQRIKDD
jgi:hypothetical protein